jgi:hypothetical protein
MDINLLDIYHRTTFSIQETHVAILLESREIDIKILLKQVSRFLTEDWSVILFVTDEVFFYYESLCNSVNNSIQVKRLTYHLTSQSDYNKIMLSLNFWKELKDFEKVLIFQADCMIYRHGIEQFYNYDYIGAPWPTSLGTEVLVGNGGFSLRTISSVIYCLEHLNEIQIKPYAQYELNANKLDGLQPEDIIFSHGMKQFKFCIPDATIAKYFSIETVEHNKQCIGSHQLDRFNPELSKELLYQSIMPYYVDKQFHIDNHRAGWNYVMNHCKPIFKNQNGIYFHTWTDIDYISLNQFGIGNRPWIGLVHFTPNSFHHYNTFSNIDNFLNHPNFIKDINHCKGIFTLSVYMKDYVKKHLVSMGYPNLIVDALYHPTEIVSTLFDPEQIPFIDTIISLGSQLRRNTTIFLLHTPIRKIWLSGRTTDKSYDLLFDECKEIQLDFSALRNKPVSIQSVSNEEYDTLLLNSFVLIDVYEASANNALIECIVRNQPCFVRRHPAIVEYIGASYPLLFDTILELEMMLENKELIRSAYDYLVDNPYLKERLTMESFVRDILNSPITRGVLCI